jgi:hypothetical protein
MNNHGRILLLYGEMYPRHLITQSLAWILLKDAGLSRHLYLVDGANAFDAYGLVRFIARRGQDPSIALKRIHISRAFTCYQLAERIATLAPSPSLTLRERGSGGPETGERQPPVGKPSALERREDAGTPALYLLGLLDTFYDESVPLPEALRLLDQVLAQLRRQRARDTLVIIVTKLPPVKTADRTVMVQRVREQADAVYRIGDID